MYVLSDYIFYFILSYFRRAIYTQTNPKPLIEKKNTPNTIFKAINSN